MSADIFKEISAVIAPSVPEWYGVESRFDANQTPQIRSFAHSFIARYAVTGTKETEFILVKIAHKSNQETDVLAALGDESLRRLARNEMSHLRATWKAFQQLENRDLIAVQPLTYLEPWNAIVMREIKAQPLRLQLVSPKIGFSQPEASAQFIEQLRKASQWLRHYHDVVGNSQMHPASKLLLKDRLAKISVDAANHLGTRFDIQKKLAALKTRLESVSSEVEAISQLHGDFHCSNILATAQGQVCVLDPRADSGRYSVYNDLATMTVDLYIKPIPIFTGGRFTRPFLDQARRAIVESYFKPGEFSQPLFNFYCAAEVIFKWSMNERDFVRNKKMRMVAPLVRPIFARYMNNLVNQFI